MTTTLSHQEDNSSQAHPNSKFIGMQQPEVAKHIKVYLNGNGHFPGRRFVVNRRTCDFTGFLDQVTEGIKAPFGAIRNVYTPECGHRVEALQDIRNGMDLVAAGPGRFRKIGYRDIAIRKKPSPKKNTLEITHRNRMEVSAKWNKDPGRPCTIFVYANNKLNSPAVRVLLKPRTLTDMEHVLTEVDCRINPQKATRFLCDLKYKKILEPKELVNGSHYVAVESSLKKMAYGTIPAFLQNSNRRNTGSTLPPIKTYRRPRPPAKEEDSQTYTKMYARKKYMKEEETTIMGASAATGYKPLTTKKYKPQKPQGPPPSQDAESVFHAKPVKVKRSGGGRAPALLTTTNNEGVFRNDVSNINAEEVEEDEDTKVDLPIDQVPADVVEDEEIAAVSNDNLDDENAPDEPIGEDHGANVSSSGQIEDMTLQDNNIAVESEEPEPPAPVPSSGFVVEKEEEIADEITFDEEEKEGDKEDQVEENKNYELKKESPLPPSSDPVVTEDETKVFEAALQTAVLDTNRASTPLGKDKDQNEDEVHLNEDESVELKNDVDSQNAVPESDKSSSENRQDEPVEDNDGPRIVPGVEDDIDAGEVVNNSETKPLENDDEINEQQNKSEDAAEVSEKQMLVDDENEKTSVEDVQNGNAGDKSEEITKDATDTPANESTEVNQQEKNELEEIVRTPSSPRPPTEDGNSQLVSKTENSEQENENPNNDVEKQNTSEGDAEDNDDVAKVDEAQQLPAQSTENNEADEKGISEGDPENGVEVAKNDEGSYLSSESTARPASEAVTSDDGQPNESVENKSDQPPNEVKAAVGNGIVQDTTEADS